jgi:HK97 gp10 family phage protein
MGFVAGVEIIGMDVLIEEIERLPETVTNALRAHARTTALAVKARARELIPFETGVTRDSIAVHPDLENKQYIVSVFGAPHLRRYERTADFKQLPYWLEFGTKKMPARPYMRPAADENEEPYVRGVEQVIEHLWK